MPHDYSIGRVQLVGAGPGSADLLTVRAVRALENAQAVLYDALVGEEVLGLAPSACLKIQTGKRAGRASMKQETINRLMLRLARRGLRVVRLKGGDPSIFGRVGEESAFLKAHGAQVEIIPGVTAACAAAAQFDFPLTHRGQARRVVFATGTTSNGALTEGGWASAADVEATLVLYMGRDHLTAAAARLVHQGRSASTPAVAIENAGRPEARAIYGMLGDLGERTEAAAPSGPVVVVIGDVAKRCAAWAGRRSTRRLREAFS